MRSAIGMAVLFLTLGTNSVSQAPHQTTREKQSALATNELWPKAGMGIINTSLYIDLRSDRNELLLDAGKRWTGQKAGETEVVIVYRDRVWQLRALPKDFALNEATVVSFEAKRVRFFNFLQMEGGFYRRGANNE